jgi:hypothetical protein
MKMKLKSHRGYGDSLKNHPNWNRSKSFRHQNMDRIILLESKKNVEVDSFLELLNKNDGKFKEIWNHQINGVIN